MLHDGRAFNEGGKSTYKGLVPSHACFVGSCTSACCIVVLLLVFGFFLF